MNDLIVKNVNVMGDSIMAAKDKDGVIWVGIRWLCQGMGMTDGHYKRQIKNIQKDLLLKNSGSNLILNKGSGERETFCLKLDYLPIWLAKINITPKIQQEHPELAAKLLNYQLKAKDILAEAFLPIKNVPQTIPEQIQLLAQGNVELNKRVDEVQVEVEIVKSDLEYLKMDLPLLPVEADVIVSAVRKRGVNVLGGKQSKAYADRGLRQKLYNDLYHDLKRQFNVRSYKAIRRKDAEKAVSVVERYQPPMYLGEQIAEVNK